jgi:hypothetical protein
MKSLLSWCSVVLVAIALGACATGSPEQSVTAGGPPSAPTMSKSTSDLVFQYRQQARELWDMARHLETEAEFHAQRQDQEQARRSRDLAKDIRTAADTAEERARDYQRQLPHGQVY